MASSSQNRELPNAEMPSLQPAVSSSPLSDVTDVNPAVHPFVSKFTDKTPSMAKARAVYLKVSFGGLFMVILLVWTVFPIFWGSLWKIPAKTLQGWIVDFDGGIIGSSVINGLQTPSGSAKITWTIVPASRFPNGLQELGNAVVEEKAWVAVSINPSSSSTYLSSIASPSATYDGSEAITVWASEARNENAFRTIIRPSIQASLEVIAKSFAEKAASSLPTSTNLIALLSTSPQSIVSPIYYTINNMTPFDIPVATAVTFVGLIYSVILSFFVVVILFSAREASGFNNNLSTRSLVTLRYISSFGAYFVLSLFYSLLTLAFQLDFTRKFGRGGFLVFWMMNYLGMLSFGLAFEAMMTILTARFIPFFMLSLVLINASVAVFPLEVMPIIFHYGYAAPFYNITKIARTVVFGTKNRVGFHFAILIVWVIISCITIPLIQWWVRRRAVTHVQEQERIEEEMDKILAIEPRASYVSQEWKAEEKTEQKMT